MYRFDSIEDYTKAFDDAYVKGLEEEKFDDFDAIALMMMRMSIAESTGYIQGRLDVIQETGAGDGAEAREAIQMEILKIESVVEVSTKKLEELGLL